MSSSRRSEPLVNIGAQSLSVSGATADSLRWLAYLESIMSDPFSREPDLLDITVTAEIVGKRGDNVILHAVIEDGTPQTVATSRSKSRGRPRARTGLTPASTSSRAF